LKETRDHLKAVIDNQQREGLTVESLIREGDPVTEIIKVIQEENIDLLIVPAHEEERIEHLLFGKVNHKLVRQMPCSILFFRQQ
jgi:nucleotide-binding universal stress UspA family protein